MARVCDRSKHSDYCDACFDSMKGLTSHQDLRGLGGSAIYCAFREFMVAHETLENCYSTKDGDVSMKCWGCIGQFDIGIEHLMEGMRMWRQSSYADSGARLKWAFDQVFDCAYSWTELKLTNEVREISSPVVHAGGYNNAASGIIQQLLPDYDPNSQK
ncbi:hypothetical protein LINGRAPRIM_LOCUS1289 [Linum grandiflorum]